MSEKVKTLTKKVVCITDTPSGTAFELNERIKEGVEFKIISQLLLTVTSAAIPRILTTIMEERYE